MPLSKKQINSIHKLSITFPGTLTTIKLVHIYWRKVTAEILRFVSKFLGLIIAQSNSCIADSMNSQLRDSIHFKGNVVFCNNLENSLS